MMNLGDVYISKDNREDLIVIDSIVTNTAIRVWDVTSRSFIVLGKQELERKICRGDYRNVNYTQYYSKAMSTYRPSVYNIEQKIKEEKEAQRRDWRNAWKKGIY